MKNVWIFFYGTFMSARILQEHGVPCKETIPARLIGYELTIRPRVNVTENTFSDVYGGVAFISQESISRLYRYLNDTFGIAYTPHPVTVELTGGDMQPALCYIAPDIQNDAADPEYIKELVKCAAELGAPEPYLEHIKLFL